MKQILYWWLCIAALPVCGQVREVLITDTAYIDYRVEDDSMVNFSFKKNKPLKGHWIVYYDMSKKKKAMEAVFKKGKLSGTEKQWHENGQLKAESSPADNIASWTYKKWYPDGTLYSERKCLNDTCTIDYYHANGVLMERAIQAYGANGQRNWFYSATYCDNGQIKFSPPLNPDSPAPQLLTTYYCSGTKKEEFTLLLVKKELLRIGHYTEWFENGNLKLQGYYDDAAPSVAGLRIGLWNYYDPEGKLIKQEEYENGKLHEMKEY